MKRTLLALAVALPVAANATISEVGDLISPITVENQPKSAFDDVWFVPSPADGAWHSDSANTDFNLGQDPASIEQAWETWYNATYDPDIDMTFVQEVETQLSPSSYSWSGDAFNWVFVHYDNKELVLYYETAITDFEVGSLDYGFSNLRTFSSGSGGGGGTGTPVSEPGTLALLALGLTGLVVARRRR